ncbi:MAG: DUF5666 domain-containing protein [Abditibacteriales bacterium]|nr:DUF5666 domain-containing protein [Abditibacteriales bacterium]MDW8365896.1 DUF5666 domain-containing protein [Abditibacteriales bacterium]
MKWKVKFLTVGLVGAAVAVSFAGAGERPQRPPGAGEGPPRPPFAGGRVTAVDKKTITVEGFGGSLTINVTDKTKFTKTVEGKVADIKKGNRIMVFGRPSEDGKTVEAGMIMVNPPQMGPFGGRPGGPPGGPGRPGGLGGPPPGGPGRPGGPGGPPPGGPGGPPGRPFGPPPVGEVTSTSPLTLKTADGKTVTVKTTDETRVMVTKDAALSDVKKDEFVMAMGKFVSEGVLEAETVRIGGPPMRRPGGPGGPPPGGPGGPGGRPDR